ncbi:hypothetical protein M8818_007406 [Zalaria obscura]|uniref:Uncharacterized protein n=1 Tax=Zalaria obscura TaxID=2024903 RepID=A0ACC3S3F0_9PEZI
MAPPNGHDNGKPQANVPKTAPVRIVPAIPRQLTKPRPVKSLVNGDKREAETSASKEEVKGPVPERRDVPQSDVPGNTTDIHGDTVKSSAAGTPSEGLTRSETLEQDAPGE